MAERRMFTKKVTDDDNFMSLSASAQALYLHLSMSADDDGFCNQVTVSMFKAHASVADLEALLSKRYLYQFENGVIVIKHWRMANALRKDRYTPTAFQEELARLQIKDNGAYTLDDGAKDEPRELTAVEKRKEATEGSTLPYSFGYKIRRAFYGRECPICGTEMRRYEYSDNYIPTIQHNIPLSKGGRHELGNISVVCRHCNVSLRDKETGELNAAEVAEEWAKISGCRLVANCLPQDRLGKNSIDKDIKRESKKRETQRRFTPPTRAQVLQFCTDNRIVIDVDQFIDYYTSNGWLVGGRSHMKDWQAAVRNWQRRDKAKQTQPTNRFASQMIHSDYSMDESEFIDN